MNLSVFLATKGKVNQIVFVCYAGMPGVHDSRDEPAEGAEPHPPHHTQGD